MQGLRTRESDKFNKFFSLIQDEAKKHNAIFFADAGDGHDLETPELECEDMMGWLIPVVRAEEFEPLWEDSKVDDDWTDYFTWAIWSLDGGEIHISFEG